MTASLDAPAMWAYNGNMGHLNVSLSAELQRHVDARAADGGFDGGAAYLRALAERDRASYCVDVARVQALIDEGIASGICGQDAFQVMDGIIDGVRQPDG